MTHWVFYSGIGTFHQILYRKFTLITDQKHLVKTPEPKRNRAASSWQITEVDSHVSILLPLHQVAYKHRNADTLSWAPLQANSAPQSDLICWISPWRKVLLLQKKLQRVGSWHSFRRNLSAFVGWRAVSPRGKHFWCLVSNLLKKYHHQCQFKSLSMQKLASAPVPARDGKLRPEGVNRGLNIDPPFNKMAKSGEGDPVLCASETSLTPVGTLAGSKWVPFRLSYWASKLPCENSIFITEFPGFPSYFYITG